MGSPFAPVVLPLAALIAALVRWLMQGSYNPWTALAKRFYIPDPDVLGRVSPEHPIWIGLEICAVIAAIAVGLAAGGWIVRRREARRGRRAPVLRAAAWLVAVVPLIVPIAAFASGGRPAGGTDTLPKAEAQRIADGMAGTINAPAGRYEVIAHPATSIIAELSAGHDTFNANLGGIQGRWQGDPHDLSQPATAEVSADTASIDTGIDERSSHARDAYLHADKYPRITVALDRVLAANQAGANKIAFRAHGTLGLLGKTHPIEITGTIARPDDAALARLHLTGDVLVVQAGFTVKILDTALASDAGDFDKKAIPIQVSLVLRHTSG